MQMEKGYIQGKTAIVTGAASGIGLALIEELLDFGAERGGRRIPAQSGA